MDTIDHDFSEPDSKDADHPATLETGMTIGDFRVQERIGAGGMGVVYRARQISLNREVALKILGPSVRTPAGIARFRREAQAIAKLKHSGIAAIYFIGQDAQICYIAMEYVQGISLREAINRLQAAPAGMSHPDNVLWATRTDANNSSVLRFDVPEEGAALTPDPTQETDRLSPDARRLLADPTYLRWCVRLVRDAAVALAHAHKEGIVHRDVKPENLLIDSAGKVTVIDFGLARFYEDETITHTGQLVGTPLYMSPEQIIGKRRLDERTDIYSLGMVLHELLTLEPPLTAPNRESLFLQIVTRAVPPIGWANPAVLVDLEAIAHQALAKDPDERYATMTRLADDLDRFLAGKPVSAPDYRYRFDDSEIAAQRPSDVVTFAFLHLFVGTLLAIISFFVLLFATGAILLSRDNDRISVAPLVIGGSLGIAAILSMFSASSLWSGRRWSLWRGVERAYYALAPAALIFGIALLFGLDWRRDGFTRERFVLDFGLSVGAPIWVAAFSLWEMWSLSRPSARKWFQFAAECRAEFERQKRKRKFELFVPYTRFRAHLLEVTPVPFALR